MVTALAFRIQNEYNELIDLVKSQHPARDTEEDEIDDEDENEMRRSDKGFVIAELLKLAVNLDYSDEIGRRKMFALVRKSACLFLNQLVAEQLHVG